MPFFAQQTTTKNAVYNEHLNSAAAIQEHESLSSEYSKEVQPQQKAPALRQTFECDVCHLTYRSAEGVQQHKAYIHNQTTDAEPEHEPQSQAAVTNGTPWTLHPSLHDDVAEKLAENRLSLDFHADGGFEDAIEEYDTFVTGTFTCPNKTCYREKWGSGKIAITIHLYSVQRYNAHVWHQKCLSCESIGELELDDQTYVDRVVYRLRKWLGVKLEREPYHQNLTPPHLSELCEGCKNGHCREGGSDRRMGQLQLE